MRLINIIKSAFTGKTYNDKQPQLAGPHRAELTVVRPGDRPKARISVPSNEDVMKSFQNIKGTNLMKINNPHIDFSRSMKIPEHMNGDNLKMKINPEVEKKAKATDKLLHKFRK